MKSQSKLLQQQKELEESEKNTQKKRGVHYPKPPSSKVNRKRKREDVDEENGKEGGRRFLKYQRGEHSPIPIATLSTVQREVQSKLEGFQQKGQNLSQDERDSVCLEAFKKIIGPLSQWIDLLKNDEVDSGQFLLSVTKISIFFIAVKKALPPIRIENFEKLNDAKKILSIYSKFLKLIDVKLKQLPSRFIGNDRDHIVNIHRLLYTEFCNLKQAIGNSEALKRQELLQKLFESVKSAQAAGSFSEENEKYDKSFELFTSVHEDVNTWLFWLIRRPKNRNDPFFLSSVDEILNIFFVWNELLHQTGVDASVRLQSVEEILESLKWFMVLASDLENDPDFRKKNLQFFEKFQRGLTQVVYGLTNEWTLLLDHFLVTDIEDGIHKPYQKAFKIAKKLFKFYNAQIFKESFEEFSAAERSGEFTDEHQRQGSLQSLIEFQKLLCLIDCSQANHARSNRRFEEALQHHRNWLRNLFNLYNLAFSNASSKSYFAVTEIGDPFDDHGEENRAALLRMHEQPPMEISRFNLLECLIPLIHCLTHLKIHDENCEAWMECVETCLLFDIEAFYNTGKDGKTDEDQMIEDTCEKTAQGQIVPEEQMIKDALISRFNCLDHIFLNLKYLRGYTGEDCVEFREAFLKKVEADREALLKKAEVHFEVIQFFDHKIKKIERLRKSKNGRHLPIPIAQSGYYFEYHFYQGLYCFYRKKYFEASENFQEALKWERANKGNSDSSSQPAKSQKLYILMGNFAETMAYIYNKLDQYDLEKENHESKSIQEVRKSKLKKENNLKEFLENLGEDFREMQASHLEKCFEEVRKRLREMQAFNGEINDLLNRCDESLQKYVKCFKSDFSNAKTVLHEEMKHLRLTFGIAGPDADSRVKSILSLMPLFAYFYDRIRNPEKCLDEIERSSTIVEGHIKQSFEIEQSFEEEGFDGEEEKEGFDGEENPEEQVKCEKREIKKTIKFK